MPPSLSARDSPRNLHGRRRTARGQIARSGSLFGTLKNLVTAPLAWLSSQDDFEDTPGKRRRTARVIERDEDSDEEDRPTVKRKRVDSPEASPTPLSQPTRPTRGYLDVPEELIPKQSAPRQRLTAPAGNFRSSSFTPSLSVPGMQEAHFARRTASPTIGASFSQPAAIQRTQSMDPPAYRAISLSRDVSMEGGLTGSATRDVTMSPTRQTPFKLRSRSSLTPQPSGQSFGPNPQSKGRDASEPPPLAALMSNPVFLKPPPQLQQSQPEQPVTTLGSLAESKGHTGRTPMRQYSGLFLGARPGSTAESRSTPFLTPVNAAEKALHDLDVYKTPLLPSRLRGSQTIPDMFKPKKLHAPVLMRSEREHKPRLGTSEKLKDREQANAARPYAGRSSMKKMLAKRKMEEEEELKRERASAIETDQDEEASERQKVDGKASERERVDNKIPDATLPPPEPAPPVRPIGGREQSSLRVGRTRVGRNHIERPVSKGRNRFSAAFDDDEGDDTMLDESREQKVAGEPKKLPILFESPKGFSFAQEKPPIAQDANAKEPPIPALPFSLTKSSAPSAPPSAPATQSFSFGEPPKVSQPEPASPSKPEAVAAAPATSLFPPVPSISLVPPSPAPPKPESGSTTTGIASSIPNFFANSSIFSKPGVNIAPPASAPVAPSTSSDAHEDKTKSDSDTPQTSSTPAPFSFGGSGSSSLFGNSAQISTQETEAAKEEPKPAASSLFGTGSSGTPFSFGNTGASAAPSTSTPSLFTSSSSSEPKDGTTIPSASSFFASRFALPAPEERKMTPSTGALVPASSATSSPFSFGAPAKPTEPPAPSPSPFSFGASSASPASAPSSTPAPFTFGAPKTELPKEPENKPLFGAAAEPPKPSLFGAPAPTPSPFGGSQPASASTDTAPKSPFTFGQPTQTASSGSTIEAPKPIFPSSSSGGSGGFTFGTSTASTPPAPATPAKSPFSFGAAPATSAANSTTESKPAFSFGAPSPAPPVSAPTSLFGGPSTGSNGTDASNKPFSFGAPPRAATPPKEENEMRMEESPTRNGGMEMNGHEQPKPSTGFTFGAPSGSSGISPFGQPSQSAAPSFSFGAKTDPKQESKPAAPFSFGTSTSSGGGFGFGQKPAESVQSPISPAPFGSSMPFGQSSTTPAPSAPAFSFGAPSAPSGGFGQPTSSTPASPSTFGQPAPFSFGTPTSATAPSNPFAFGSQPASPATGNAGLPQPPGSSGGPGFSFGQPSPATAQSPASPFGAAPPAPGGVSFTIGAAAPQPQGTSGARAIKKLPTRRGGRR
ncbi:hypothetical protein BN946_scf184834.g23 [Trametes cinnabarina]|uniref:Uncharacterized protein n=1 Tax=Pycnoporus cinnabarinus TaxID=5643 RepID=A0A060S4A4_PYCCI|nr:hypothetical protein BN946_scf184834.g23 [Trametes cinnabarina]